jgi:hypothetical protein
MNNIFATARPIEFQPSRTDLRNWRFLGTEMEVLGARLDAARAALAGVESEWGCWYWTETIDRLMLQWRTLVPLHDGEATMTRLPRWTLNYEWWEGSAELQYTGLEGITDAVFNRVFRGGDDLEDVWRRHRDARLMRCN